MQFGGQGAPVGIVFDTGLSRPGDVLALALLHGLAGKREARLIGLAVGRSSLAAAAFIDAVGLFYLEAPRSGPLPGFIRTPPVGLALESKLRGDLPLFAVPVAKQGADGKPFYRRNITRLTDTAEAAPAIRNALTAQADNNAIVILSGPATNLASLLALKGAKDVIAQKVRFLAIAAGAYPEGGPDPYLEADTAAAQKLLAEWPTPVIACGSEVGGAVSFPGSSIEKDFAWTPSHPIADAYRAHAAMSYDASSETLAAALYSVRAKESGLNTSEPGTISVAAGGRVSFNPSPDGKHHYLVLDPLQKERIVRGFVELASAKPVPRPPRRPQ